MFITRFSWRKYACRGYKRVIILVFGVWLEGLVAACPRIFIEG